MIYMPLTVAAGARRHARGGGKDTATGGGM